MADFVGVLKKQLEKHGEPSSELRKRIYENARAALGKKLADYSPPLSADVVSKQKRSLEDAISSVEREYTTPAPPNQTRAAMSSPMTSSLQTLRSGCGRRRASAAMAG